MSKNSDGPAEGQDLREWQNSLWDEDNTPIQQTKINEIERKAEQEKAMRKREHEKKRKIAEERFRQEQKQRQREHEEQERQRQREFEEQERKAAAEKEKRLEELYEEVAKLNEEAGGNVWVVDEQYATKHLSQALDLEGFPSDVSEGESENPGTPPAKLSKTEETQESPPFFPETLPGDLLSSQETSPADSPPLSPEPPENQLRISLYDELPKKPFSSDFNEFDEKWEVDKHTFTNADLNFLRIIPKNKYDARGFIHPFGVKLDGDDYNAYVEILANVDWKKEIEDEMTMFEYPEGVRDYLVDLLWQTSVRLDDRDRVVKDRLQRIYDSLKPAGPGQRPLVQVDAGWRKTAKFVGSKLSKLHFT